MTKKKHSPWLEKLEKEGLLDENPVWRVEDPTAEDSVTIQAESGVTADDPTLPVDLRTAVEREDQTPVLNQTVRSKNYPSAAMREAMEKRESAVDLPKLASHKPAAAAPAESDVEASWFAKTKPRPNGSYSHTEGRRAISVHGRRISVDPKASSEHPAKASGAILDEPPVHSEPPKRSSQAPARFLPDDDALFGGGSDDDTGAKRLRDAMRECYDLGDFTGALENGEALLRFEQDDREALALVRDCRSTLAGMYETRLGSIAQTPRRTVAVDELVWRRLDPTATFIVSLVDGVLSLENIIDICGLPRFEALRILARLKEEGIID